MLFRLFAVAILFAPTVRGQQNDNSPAETKAKRFEVQWLAPFGKLTSGDQHGRLIMMLITDADPWLTSADDPALPAKPWCQPVFAKSLRALLEYRPDLKARIEYQHLAAGMPTILTGGKDPGLPHRAMLVVLDHDHRMLAWMIGVPESQPLMTLVEDAEEVEVMSQRYEGKLDQLGDELAKRNVARLDRRWAAAFNEQWLVMSGRPESDAHHGNDDEWILSRVSVLATLFRQVYKKDVALRFGLTNKLDHVRLAVLEQHPEARRPWCESMLPFVACIDFQSAWHMLVESAWDLSSVSSTDDATELLSWWDDLPEDRPVVLSLHPPLFASTVRWPPTDGDGIAAKVGRGWDALQEMLLTANYRDVRAYELSHLMRDRQFDAIDIHSPSRVRYLYFESKTKKPVLIREGDIPARHIAHVKRNQN